MSRKTLVLLIALFVFVVMVFTMGPGFAQEPEPPPPPPPPPKAAPAPPPPPAPAPPPPPKMEEKKAEAKQGGGGGAAAPLEIIQENEQESESGDVDQSFDVSSTGDNSNQCVGIQGVANTGNAQNQSGVTQIGSDADDFEFDEVGSDVVVSPENSTTCDQQVNQAASASGSSDKQSIWHLLLSIVRRFWLYSL